MAQTPKLVEGPELSVSVAGFDMSWRPRLCECVLKLVLAVSADADQQGPCRH